jgi:hypothetical protein
MGNITIRTVMKNRITTSIATGMQMPNVFFGLPIKRIVSLVGLSLFNANWFLSEPHAVLASELSPDPLARRIPA